MFLPEEEEDEEEELVPDEEDNAITEAARMHNYVELRHSSLVKEFVWYGGKDIRNPDVQEASYSVDGARLTTFVVLTFL